MVKLLRLKAIYKHIRRLDNVEYRRRPRNLLIFSFLEPNGEYSDLITFEIYNRWRDWAQTRSGCFFDWKRTPKTKKRQGKAQPVTMSFFDYNEKLAVLNNYHKLKEPTTSINQDFCKCALAKRSKLWSCSGELKANGSKVSLDYDKLQVDGDV